MASSKGNHASLSEFEVKATSETAIWRQAEWGDMRVGDDHLFVRHDTRTWCP